MDLPGHPGDGHGRHHLQGQRDPGRRHRDGLQAGAACGTRSTPPRSGWSPSAPGGGSIAWTDPKTGLLKVGPEGAGGAAGARMLPDWGGRPRPTVSDADLGARVPESGLLPGRAHVAGCGTGAPGPSRKRSPSPLGAVGGGRGRRYLPPSSTTPHERPHPPRHGGAGLRSLGTSRCSRFGGAGPVHAARYAAELGIRQVVVPLTASVHSATGLVSSDIVYQYGKVGPVCWCRRTATRVNRDFDELARRARADLAARRVRRRRRCASREASTWRYRYPGARS